MRKKSYLILMLAVLIISAAWIVARAQDNPRPSYKTWDYKVVRLVDPSWKNGAGGELEQPVLSQEGKDGWELVSVVVSRTGLEYLGYMRRPKQR
jgi:hypothetical protein